MLTNELRKELMEKMKQNPQAVMEELKKDPKLLEILLTNSENLEKANEEIRNERIKYINMTSEMQRKLEEQATKLKTTQGLLLGAGLVFVLSQLEKR